MQCGLQNHLKDFNNKQKETQNPFTKKLQPLFFFKKKMYSYKWLQVRKSFIVNVANLDIKLITLHCGTERDTEHTQKSQALNTRYSKIKHRGNAKHRERMKQAQPDSLKR